MSASLLLSILSILLAASAVTSRNYTFLPDDIEIFSVCADAPQYNIKTFLDLSNVTFEYRDERVHIEGSATMIWNAQPTDRLELFCNAHKHVRGMWVPTVLNVYRYDLCPILFDPDEIWYKGFLEHIFKEDRKCFNVAGHTYHARPFDVFIWFDIDGMDASGRYKLTCNMLAHDDEHKIQRARLCFGVMGDVVNL